MKGFKEFIEEAILSREDENEILKLAKQLTDAFKKHFPQGHAEPGRVDVKQAGQPYVNFSLGLVGNRRHLYRHDRREDPIYSIFELSKLDDNKYQISELVGSYLLTDRGYKKIPFRVIVGDDRKVVSDFERYASRVKAAVKKHEDELTKRDQIPDIYFRL